MTDGGQDFDLGQVVGSAGEKGDDGSTVWNTSTAPTYANSKYTFNISNLSGKTGLEIAVNDIIFYSTYYYIVSAVGSTTVDCNTRVNIKGSDASVTIVDNLTSTSSTSALSAKQGKVLNDNKVETSAIATSWGSTLSDTKVPSEKLTKNSLDSKADASSLATVATSGDYDDLTDKPTIPSKISDLTNDSDFIEKSNTSGLIKNDGTIDTTSYSTFSGSYNDLLNKPTIPSASSTTPSADTTSGSYGSGTSYARSNHTHPKSSLYAEATHSHTKSQITDFPSIPSSSSDLSDGSDLVKKSSTTGLLKNDGSVMTSGTGSSNWAVGNHTHSAYVNPTIVDNLTSDSSTSVLSAKQGKELKTLVDGKQSTLVSGTNIKTINNNSLLTSGNISVLGMGDIANNLTTTAAGKVLDARQGKELYDMIGSAITYITGSGS